MKFLLDQSADARLVPYFRSRGHDAVRVGRDYPPGLPDEEVLALARTQSRTLITNDRDFGELVFRHRQGHAGVLYFRLPAADLALTIARLEYVLTHHAHQVYLFLVVTKERSRARPGPRAWLSRTAVVTRSTRNTLGP